ncbi:hypothetical protein [Aestuariibaculum lutulentum]|uniref:DUF4382 domain-containing protein n=1 Tax=Aestuariibaculum lutulentum TaxID=2920935 RepID=A0ABS9RKC9_9FLAO|nr:hypothetical protein [Aestuariibaculum lutulentum]MCH4553413.1 hypothetical protein [Aestuariibaculum lutulentum]
MKRFFIYSSFLLFIFLYLGCKSKTKSETEITVEEKVPVKPYNTYKDAIVFKTLSMEFIGLDTIPSGWNTFKYMNRANETHFILLDKYPQGKTIEDGEKEIIPVFDKGMDLINEGNAEAGFAEFGKLPEWFPQIVFTGGSGLIAGGETSITTLHLEPGYYVMECYVKMPNGKFHNAMGMVKELIVIDEDSGNIEPKEDVEIAISNDAGIVIADSLPKGQTVFKVTFKDQKLHENFVQTDIHLAEISDSVNLDALESWMDWANPKGLITPVPEGVKFLGGIQEMPAGKHGYFTADLRPGRYVLISEVPASKSKNLLKVFNVSD